MPILSIFYFDCESVIKILQIILWRNYDYSCHHSAAGKGIRAGGKVPKQWRTIAGKPVIDWSTMLLECN